MAGNSTSLAPLPSDAQLIASLGNLQGQPSLRHRLDGFSVAPTPGNDLTGDQYSEGQAPTRTLGPYSDDLGRSPVNLRHVSGSNSLALPLDLDQLLRLPASTTSPGNIWLSTALFPSVPSNSEIVGLRISQGALRITGVPASGAATSTDANSIVVPVSGSIMLTLTLVAEPLSQNAKLPTGELAVQTPGIVTFMISSQSITLSTLDQASLLIFGTSYNLSRNAANPAYDSATNHVLFPLNASQATLSVQQSSALLGTWAGSAHVNGAFWALPVTTGPSTASPNSLPPTSGSGGILLSLAAGLTVTVKDQKRPVQCGASSLLVVGSSLVITGAGAQGGNSRQTTIQLQSQSNVIVLLPQNYTFRYVNEYNGHESWAVGGESCTTKLNQLRTVDNTPFSFQSRGGLFTILKDLTSTICMIEAAAFRDVDIPPKWPFALKNLLITTMFPTIVAYGLYDTLNAIMSDETIQLKFSAQESTPILPDPYTSNLQAGLAGSVLFTLVDGSNGQLTISGITITPTQSASTQSATAQSVSTQLASALIQPDAVAQTAVRQSSPASLLDLSTKTSQFGVAFILPTTPTVENLYLTGPANQVGIMALPAVQWEPVTTVPNPDSFPSPLSYPNCGPNTIVVSQNTVTLVPIVPRQAIDTVISLYQSNPSSEVLAQFTLPFGIVANAQLTRSALLLSPSPSLTKVAPSFSKATLQAADQLSIQGPGRGLTIIRPPQPSAPTTSIPGTVTLLENALASGQTTTTTVLGAIQDTFNSTFSQNPRIPVTRIDISGYGESMFSDWRDPTSLPPTISKVALEVMVGRTSGEVVQAYSILYPYGVAVVRDITIERQNTGFVIRTDSGWQAVSNGNYQFPTASGTPSPITHPGVIKGVVNVTNIRDLGTAQMYNLVDPKGNIELMPVKFDCSIVVENVVSGGSSAGVPATDQLGYVQITSLPGGGSLSATQYSTLLNDRGPLGGSIDCVTNIGKSGLQMRILRVQVGASNPTPDLEFAMAAYGAPVLPKNGPGGQWTFVMNPQGGTPSQSIDPANGVPLIQQNPASTGATPQPYRFADPADILAPDNAANDYGILFSTPAHKVLFLRPKINPSTPFQITSTLTPFIADAFASSNSSTPFPPISSCIPITDPNWNLPISTTGDLKLQLSSPTFTTTSLRRVLLDNPNLRSIAYTSNEQTPPVPSTITLALDSSSSTWTCNITNLSYAMETNDYGEVLRVVGDMNTSSSTAPTYTNTKVVFGPKLGAVTKLVAFLQDFGLMPPFQVAFGSITGSGFMDLQKALSMGQLGPFSDFIEEFVIDLDFKILAASSEDDSSMEITCEITFKIPAGAGMLVLLGAVDLKMESAGNIWQITVGGGYGYELPLVDPLEAYAYAAIAMHITFGDGVFGFGISVLIKADIDLVVVEASTTAELRGDMLHVTCGSGPGDKSLWAVGQVKLALEITIFLVCDIEFDYQHEWTKNTDGGPCPLPDVV